jgi:hypothetical protein
MLCPMTGFWKRKLLACLHDPLCRPFRGADHVDPKACRLIDLSTDR